MILTHPSAGANSLVALAWAEDFFSTRPANSKAGWLSLGTNEEKESHLITGSADLLVLCSGYAGERAPGLLHDLPFPRLNMVNRNTGLDFPSDEVPRPFMVAACLMADARALANPFQNPLWKGLRKGKLDQLTFEANPDDYADAMPNEARLLIAPYCTIKDKNEKYGVYSVRV